jgi:renalase
MMNIVAIGACLVVARQLEDKFKVIVFEKFCGVSGRLARRYAEDVVFDHGAQYFTVRSRAFRSFIRPMLADGLLQSWSPKVVTIE